MSYFYTSLYIHNNLVAFVVNHWLNLITFLREREKNIARYALFLYFVITIIMLLSNLVTQLYVIFVQCSILQ